MKQRLVFFGLLLVFFHVSAQKLLPIRENYFWGFIDTTGTVVIPPRYEQVGEFDQYGYVMVRDQQKIGMITKHNKVIVPCQYDNIRSLDATHISFLQGESWGALDLNTKKQTPAEYKSINILYNRDSLTIYGVRKGLRWGAVRSEGEELVAPVYKKIAYHDSAFWVINEGDRMGLFGFNGNFLLPEIHDSVYLMEYPHVRCVFKSQGGDALFNMENERQTEYNIQEAFLTKKVQGFVCVRESFKGWNVLKLSDYSPIFEQYYNFIDEQEHYFLLRKANVFGAADFSGNIIIEPQYDRIHPGPNKGFWIERKGLMGYANAKGKEILPPNFLRVADLNRHYYLVMHKDNKIQIITKQGKAITEAIYTDIVQEEEKFKLYHANGVLILTLDEQGLIADRTDLTQVATLTVKGQSALNRFNWTTPGRMTSTTTTTVTTTTTITQEEEIKKTHTHNFVKFYQDSKVGLNIEIEQGQKKMVLDAQYLAIQLDDFYYGNVARAILVGGRQCLIVRNGDAVRPVYNFNVLEHGKTKIASIAFVGEFSKNGLAPINVGGRNTVISDKVNNQSEENEIWTKMVSSLIVPNRGEKIPTYGSNQVPGGTWGFINREGKMVISANYDQVKPFLGNRAIVAKNKEVKTTQGKKQISYWGVLGEANDTIIPLDFGKIEPVKLADDKYIFYVYTYRNLQGIANRYGKEISEVAYRKIGNESEGMIPVQKGSYWLYLDTLGNIYKNMRIQMAGDFGEDIAPVRVNNTWGYINAKQDTVIKFIYKQADKFSKGLAPVKLHHHYGYINKEGKFIVKEKYQKAAPFQENGLAVVKRRGKEGLIDTQGKAIVGHKYYHIENFDRFQLALVKDHHRRKDYLLLNPQGKAITKRKYQYISAFSDDSLAIVRKHHHYGIINTQGIEILNPKKNKQVFTYKKVKGSDYEVVKKKLAMFSKIGPFNNGLAAAEGYNVETRKKAWGYIDKNLKWVVDPIYSEATDFKDGFALVYNKIAEQWYIIDAQNLTVKGIGNFEEASYSNGLILVREKYSYYYLNEEGKKAFYTGDNEIREYVRANSFIDGYAVVQTSNGYGMIDVTGTPALSDHYRAIYPQDNFYIVTINTFVGIKDHEGKDVLSADYERIDKVTPTILQVKKGGQIGYIFSNGVWLWEPKR